MSARQSEKAVDYRDEVRLSGSKLVRYALLAVGSISLVLGTLGVFLPVLPTTPFLLLTAACYARGSVRVYNWLMNNRYFGGYIRAWRQERRIPVRMKMAAIIMIAITIGSSVAFFIPLLPVKILTGLIGIAVIVYIARFPS